MLIAVIWHIEMPRATVNEFDMAPQNRYGDIMSPSRRLYQIYKGGFIQKLESFLQQFFGKLVKMIVVHIHTASLGACGLGWTSW